MNFLDVILLIIIGVVATAVVSDTREMTRTRVGVETLCKQAGYVGSYEIIGSTIYCTDKFNNKNKLRTR